MNLRGLRASSDPRKWSAGRMCQKTASCQEEDLSFVSMHAGCLGFHGWAVKMARPQLQADLAVLFSAVQSS